MANKTTASVAIAARGDASCLGDAGAQRIPLRADGSRPNSSAASTRYLTRREMADKFGNSEKFWERLAIDGGGPPMVKIGRSVRYPEHLVDEWAQQRLCVSTSDTSVRNARAA